ncbi:MAG: hypothetical protein ACAI34_25940, partial [Verrucomicrobium sp.]
MKPQRQRGSALIITVLLLAVIAAVVVGFLTSVRVERSAVHAHFERQRAGRFAAFGLEQTIATLRRETACRVEVQDLDGKKRRSFQNYLTHPGGLIVPEIPTAPAAADAVAPFQLKREVPLSSGRATVLSHTAADSVLDPPNLNLPVYSSEVPAHLLTERTDATGAVAVMPVKWIYVRQNQHGQPRNPAVWTEELDESESPVVDAGRPIVGRHAYWVDDESTKINYNTAWKRDPGPNPSAHSNPNRAAHPSLVNLMGLAMPDGTLATEGTVDTLFRWRDRTPSRPFNSFADARQADPGLLQLLDHNKFELTYYNHDPDMNSFGEGRILLTTRRDLVPVVNGVRTRPFLDIMREDVEPYYLDSGLRDDIAGGQQDWRGAVNGSTVLPNKFDTTVRLLMHYLEAKSWPVAPGSSFRDKLFPGSTVGDPRLAQLAVNIIEYVRAKESRLTAVAPLHWGVDAAGKYTLHASVALGPDSWQGVNRNPLITEMAMTVAAVPVTMPVGASSTPPDWPRQEGSSQPRPLYPCQMRVELHLPSNYQVVDSGGLTGIVMVPVKTVPLPVGSQGCWFIDFHETHTAGRTYYAFSPQVNSMVPLASHSSRALPLQTGDLAGKSTTTLRPGNYATVTKTVYREQSHAEAPEAALRCSLYQGTSGADGLLQGDPARWSCFNQAPHRESVKYIISAPGTVTDATLPSVEVDDPRVNVSVKDWQPAKSGANTFGSVSSLSTLGKVPVVTPGLPQQDTDAAGLLTEYGCLMPPPLGAGTNADPGDNGYVTTVGELGYVCTGVDAGGTGTPWRTLRLQPNRETTSSVVPDWA